MSFWSVFLKALLTDVKLSWTHLPSAEVIETVEQSEQHCEKSQKKFLSQDVRALSHVHKLYNQSVWVGKHMHVNNLIVSYPETTVCAHKAI